jgi:hydroxyacyl-ACP dehydratase HTD2-like protein with hotdog domain
MQYDFPYATNIDGYGGLVVCGPMQATIIQKNTALR